MKNPNLKIVLFVIFFSLFMLVSQAKAEGTTTVQLKVVAFDQVLFDNNFIVSSCPDQASSTNYTLNAWCAVDQLVSSQGWTAISTWYPYGIMLNAINQYEGTDSNYWLWFSNSEPGETALNQHILFDGEKLLLSFGTSPLKITTSTTSPYINTTTTLNALYFDVSLWQWQSATSSIFSINGQDISSVSGIYELWISTTTAYRVFAKGAGFIDSEPITITPQIEVAPIATTTTTTTTPTEQPLNNPGRSFGGGTPTHHTVDVNKAINFLVLNQNSDGSIGSSIIYSDWAGIALSNFNNGDAKNKLKNYLSGAKYNTNGSITDLERRAMALMALSINPYSGTETDYISKILLAFDGTQIGDPNLFNDDIFAIFPLLKAGYSGSDLVIKATIKFIISKQIANGSWGNIDITAGAIQALSLAKKTGNLDADIINLVDQSLQLAKGSLKNSQDTNGGFGNNAISTSWAVQAMMSLDEQVLAWENNGNNPFDFLASRQNSDGGLEDTSVATDTRIWTTAYVIPAALGKTWGEILGSFQKQIQNGGTGGANNLPAIATSTSATTSASLPTSTLELASSTISTASLTLSTTSIGEKISEPQNETSTEPVWATSTTSSSSEVLLKIKTGRNLSSEKLENPAQQNEPAKEDYSKNLTAQISDSIGPIHPDGEKTIKIVFYLLLGAVSILGLYLTVKFLIFKA